MQLADLPNYYTAKYNYFQPGGPGRNSTGGYGIASYPDTYYNIPVASNDGVDDLELENLGIFPTYFIQSAVIGFRNNTYGMMYTIIDPTNIRINSSYGFCACRLKRISDGLNGALVVYFNGWTDEISGSEVGRSCTNSCVQAVAQNPDARNKMLSTF
jgi:hypothetical protein